MVLHGWWQAGQLALWAEDSTAPGEPPKRPGRRPRTQVHPYAVDGGELAKVLDALAVLPTPVAAGAAVLSLPTRDRGPVPSPELLVAPAGLDDVDADDVDASTHGADTSSPTTDGLWRVQTLLLDADAAWVLLRTPWGEDPDAPSLGAGLRLLRVLAEFAEDLAGRGRVLPAVRLAAPGQAEACWCPLVTGADAVWLRFAVTRLPPSMSAALPVDGVEVQDPVDAVAAAIDSLVDAAVRARLGTAPRRRSRTSWRAALQGSDRTFLTTDDQVQALAAALEEWQREATGGGAVRACFRLVEPPAVELRAGDLLDEPEEGRTDAAGEAPWELQFALQAPDEPSLAVDAGQIWSSRGPLRALARHVSDPQETLLAELGRAVRLYPALEAALRTTRPSTLPLDTAGAHAFLADAAPLLLASGFGVLLPAWWTSPSARLGAKLRVSTPSQPGATEATAAIGQDGLVDFRWELAVGEHTLSEQEVADLVDAQQPLVRVRGQWMQVDPDRLARARSFLGRRGKGGAGRMPVGQVLHALGSVDDGPGGLPVVGVDAEGWLGDLLSTAAEHRLTPVAPPPGFVGALRPYQQRGLSWLSFLESVGLGGVLADDMGLGKTIQLLALMAQPAKDGTAGPTLLICPMSLVGNWQREAARFTPELRVHVHHGAERPRGKSFDAAVAASDVVVTTYALLARDAAALRKVAWRRLVLDEAQAVKNAATKAAVAARSLPAPHRIAVTGTPVENRLADLWSLMEFANPGLLGGATEFRERFATPIERHADEPARARLRTLTQPFVLRRLKTDASIISDLPDKLEMDVLCTLTAEQAALYKAVVADMLDRIATTTGMERRGLVLATMTKLKQVCNHPAQFLRDGSRLAGRSGKLARLEETLDEVLAAGEKALLFTQYAEFGHLLRAHLSARTGREVAFLHGGVGKAERDAMVTRFQNAPDGPPMFVLSLKAGGTGLTLTAANHVVHVDRWWNPAVEDQATDRAFRIGQTRAVQVRKLVCAGTLEEKIATMIKDKRGLAASVVGAGEGWLTELSTAQLRDLFTLEAGSVVE